MVLMPVLKASFEEVENLPNTIRGTGGFGSTGKWKRIWIINLSLNIHDKLF